MDSLLCLGQLEALNESKRCKLQVSVVPLDFDQARHDFINIERFGLQHTWLFEFEELIFIIVVGAKGAAPEALN